MNIFKKILITTILSAPTVVSAARLQNLISTATLTVRDVLVPIAFALCLLYFFWGVAKYIRSGAGSEKAVEDGRRIMIWGIIGLFLASAIWGIIFFIRDELGIPNYDTVNIDRR